MKIVVDRRLVSDRFFPITPLLFQAGESSVLVVFRI
jgi:hypothetical protein